MNKISRVDALIYEVRTSGWANLIGYDCLQKLAAKYFAWKVRRKYKRYERWASVYERLK